MYNNYETYLCPYYANTPQYNPYIMYNFRCPYWTNVLWHNLINTGYEPIKLYSIYTPPHHARGTVHVTKADAEAAEEHRGYYYQKEQRHPRQTKEFTLNELAEYNGTMGKPAYVAINGIVYDVSANSKWSGATHFGLTAGKDLSSQFEGCHGVASSKLTKLPKVGILKG